MSVWIYAVAVSLALSLGALATERALRVRWRSGRWAWMGALIGSGALLLLALAVDRTVGAGGASQTAASIMDRSAAAFGGATSRLPLGRLWLGASLIAVAFLIGEAIWMRRRSRAWTPARIGGCRILVSSDAGPAAFGVVHPEVVVPRWVLEMPSRARRLILLHEVEHHRAGDVRLQLAAALLVAAVPWNPVAWWQAARLRRAIELDCDERVLRRTRDARAYCDVLIDVGERASGLRPVLAVGLAKPFLERRLEAILATGRSRRIAAPAILATASVLLAFAAPPPGPDAMFIAELPPANHAASDDAGAPEPAGIVRPMGAATLTQRGLGEPADTVRVRGTADAPVLGRRAIGSGDTVRVRGTGTATMTRPSGSDAADTLRVRGPGDAARMTPPPVDRPDTSRSAGVVRLRELPRGGGQYRFTPDSLPR